MHIHLGASHIVDMETGNVDIAFVHIGSIIIISSGYYCT